MIPTLKKKKACFLLLLLLCFVMQERTTMRFSECELRSSFFLFLSFLIRSTTPSREMCVCVCVCVLLFLGRAVKYGASDRV